MTEDSFSDEKFLKAIYAAIDALIEEQSSSYEELAAKSGVDVRALSSTQNNLDISTLKVIAGCFDLSLAGFFAKMEELSAS